MIDVGGASVIRCQLLKTQPVSTVKNITIRGGDREQLLEFLAAGGFTFYKEVVEICKNFVSTFIVADQYDMLRRASTISTKTLSV